jgi:hypothetical protein
VSGDFAPPEHELGRIGWATVPICSICWHKLYKKVPIRMKEPPVEICYQCLIPTQAGIYARGYAKVVQVMLRGLGLTAVYERYPN